MIFNEIKERLTGISCPIFGISWNPSQTKRTKATQIITFLEDRRVLYNYLYQECPNECIESVIEIRKFLTEKMQDLAPDSNLYCYLKAMRMACRKFSDYHFGHINNNGTSGWEFHSELGKLRGTFGIMLAQMAVTYGVDIKDELASILPEKESKE